MSLDLDLDPDSDLDRDMVFLDILWAPQVELSIYEALYDEIACDACSYWVGEALANCGQGGATSRAEVDALVETAKALLRHHHPVDLLCTVRVDREVGAHPKPAGFDVGYSRRLSFLRDWRDGLKEPPPLDSLLRTMLAAGDIGTNGLLKRQESATAVFECVERLRQSGIEFELPPVADYAIWALYRFSPHDPVIEEFPWT